MTTRAMLSYGACGLMVASCALPPIDTDYNPASSAAGAGGAAAASGGTSSKAGGAALGGSSSGGKAAAGATSQGSTSAIGGNTLAAAGTATGFGGATAAGAASQGGTSATPVGGGAGVGATTGGFVAAGGKAVAGANNGSGGINTSGGASTQGGLAGSGGSVTTGGSPATAGSSSTGGHLATGGVPNMAGSPGAAGVPSTGGSTSGVGGTAGAPNTIPLSIAAGYGHSCIVLVDGNVWCWGNNSDGTLGNGATVDGTEVVSLVPVKVINAAQATAVAAGSYHTCATLSTGGVKCWGFNGQGQLGNGVSGSNARSSTPVDVRDPTGTSILANAKAITSGSRHTCALLDGGTVVCWGLGTSGRLGSGADTTSAIPVVVSTTAGGSTPLMQVTSISATHNHTCAVRQDNSVYCWGLNDYGQLGDGLTASSNVAKLVANVQATAVAAGNEHTCARLTTGLVRCWGSDSSGQLGDGNGTASTSPATVSFTDGAKVLAIAAGYEHTCAVMDTSTRSIRCWGRNYYGQLGDATDTTSDGPVDVKSLTQAVGISGGEEHSCAYLSTGAAYCWGDNWFGTLGDGNGGHSLYSTVPVRVSGI